MQWHRSKLFSAPDKPAGYKHCTRSLLVGKVMPLAATLACTTRLGSVLFGMMMLSTGRALTVTGPRGAADRLRLAWR